MTVRALHNLMPESALAYTTVMSICNRLHEKGLLSRRLLTEPGSATKSRRVAYIYAPLIGEQTFEQRATAERGDRTHVSPPPTPRQVVDAAHARDQIERVLVYLGSLSDADGRRADDATLDTLAALLARAEAAEICAAAWRAQAAEKRAEEAEWRLERQQMPLRLRAPDHAPVHEYCDPSGVCRVCGCAVPPTRRKRQDGLRVCAAVACRKEAERRDSVNKQRRYYERLRARDHTQTAQRPADPQAIHEE